MAGDAPPQGEKFFNTLTPRGRKNCTLASFALYAGIYLLFKLKPSSKK